MMQWMRRCGTAVLVLGLVSVTAERSRASLVFVANLTHDQETPPGEAVPPLTTSTGSPRPGSPRPLSFGSATFVLNDAQTQLTMDVTISNIDVTGTQTPDTNDNLLNAHIHVGAPPGQIAQVRWG